MLLDFAIWLQNTGLMRALRESDRGYEILLSLHVSFIALSGAMVAMTNTRLLGWALKQGIGSGRDRSDCVGQSASASCASPRAVS